MKRNSNAGIFPSRSYEISRRGGVWYLGVPIGTLTAGLVQARATTSLDGVHGLSGWRSANYYFSHATITNLISFEDGCISFVAS